MGLAITSSIVLRAMVAGAGPASAEGSEMTYEPGVSRLPPLPLMLKAGHQKLHASANP
ncbi:MAG TPA: hypothetical protein VGN88_03650 [Phycisphaerae bacterium]